MSGEDALEPLADVRPPAWLSSEAKKIFKTKAQQLISLGVLTALDIDLLALYATSYADAVDSIRSLNTDGRIIIFTDDEGKTTGGMVNPAIKLYYESLKVINQLGGQFGFSPASRSSLAAGLAGKKTKGDFDEYK